MKHLVNLAPRFFLPQCLWLVILAFTLKILPANAAEWQWSVPMGKGRAFLWRQQSVAKGVEAVAAPRRLARQGIAASGQLCGVDLAGHADFDH